MFMLSYETCYFICYIAQLCLRSEILMKLQFMMQSQWNEAVQMLASTPQRKVCLFNGRCNQEICQGYNYLSKDTNTVY